MDKGIYDGRRIFNAQEVVFSPPESSYETTSPRVRAEIPRQERLAGKPTDSTLTARSCLPGPETVDPGVPKYLLEPLDPPRRKTCAETYPEPTYTFSDVRPLYDDSAWIDETIAGQCRRVGGGGALTLPSSIRDPDALLRRDLKNLKHTAGIQAFFKDDGLSLSSTVASKESLSNKLGFKVFETPRGEGKSHPIGTRRRIELVQYMKHVQPPLASGDAVTRSSTPNKIAVLKQAQIESLKIAGALVDLSYKGKSDSPQRKFEIESALAQSNSLNNTLGGLPIRPAGLSNSMKGLRDHPFAPFDASKSWLGAAGVIDSDCLGDAATEEEKTCSDQHQQQPPKEAKMELALSLSEKIHLVSQKRVENDKSKFNASYSVRSLREAFRVDEPELNNRKNNLSAVSNDLQQTGSIEVLSQATRKGRFSVNDPDFDEKRVRVSLSPQILNSARAANDQAITNLNFLRSNPDIVDVGLDFTPRPPVSLSEMILSNEYVQTPRRNQLMMNMLKTPNREPLNAWNAKSPGADSPVPRLQLSPRDSNFNPHPPTTQTASASPNHLPPIVPKLNALPLSSPTSASTRVQNGNSLPGNPASPRSSSIVNTSPRSLNMMKFKTISSSNTNNQGTPSAQSPSPASNNNNNFNGPSPRHHPVRSRGFTTSVFFTPEPPHTTPRKSHSPSSLPKQTSANSISESANSKAIGSPPTAGKVIPPNLLVANERHSNSSGRAAAGQPSLFVQK
eukprot:GDKJ01031829.1.p1 GENE.GDKJ01031829.1~~GDKJ01031829.1.p1  ORF type:complete len:794 (-),score=164.01 GDKJ01031829.1:137-2335(-)